MALAEAIKRSGFFNEMERMMMKIYFSRVVLASIVLIAFLSGCAFKDSKQPPSPPAPAPVSSAPPPAPPAPTVPTTPILTDDGWLQEDGYYQKTVRYGTTRVDSCKQPSNVICKDPLLRLDTGNEKGEQSISYGEAVVKIPYIKEVGGTDGMSLIVLNHNIGWDKFISKLANDDLLVFIHGYNTSFSGAAIRCAQLAHDTNFKGEAVFFSWPSKAWGSYKDDKVRADENFDLLADFLQDLSSKNNKKIHIVAHSMGTYILMNSLAIMNDRMVKNPKLLASRKAQNNGKIFSQIILAAPDIAKEEYRKNFTQSDFSKMADNITLYSTDNDWALKASRLVNWSIEDTSQARLGDSMEEFFVVDGMDTVDTRKDVGPQIFGHSFYAEYRSLVSDMHLLLNHEADPDDRMLQKVTDSKGQTLWFIRD